MTTAHVAADWKIRINGGENHPVPHVHVLFRDGCRVSVAIDTLELLAGSVKPNKRLLPALTWISTHRNELTAEYWRLNR